MYGNLLSFFRVLRLFRFDELNIGQIYSGSEKKFYILAIKFQINENSIRINNLGITDNYLYRRRQPGQSGQPGRLGRIDSQDSQDSQDG